mmetsp:Transcript_21417/g.40785  ORF Transcript_21417/g.40785 Transcript_21417/m.40785 type:complete len:324 (-) Transcript_21417:1581-2552(-)
MICSFWLHLHRHLRGSPPRGAANRQRVAGHRRQRLQEPAGRHARDVRLHRAQERVGQLREHRLAFAFPHNQDGDEHAQCQREANHQDDDDDHPRRETVLFLLVAFASTVVLVTNASSIIFWVAAAATVRRSTELALVPGERRQTDQLKVSRIVVLDSEGAVVVFPEVRHRHFHIIAVPSPTCADSTCGHLAKNLGGTEEGAPYHLGHLVRENKFACGFLAGKEVLAIDGDHATLVHRNRVDLVHSRNLRAPPKVVVAVSATTTDVERPHWPGARLLITPEMVPTQIHVVYRVLHVVHEVVYDVGQHAREGVASQVEARTLRKC